MANVMGFDNAVVNGNVITIAPGNYGGVFVAKNTFTQPMVVDAQGAIFSSTVYLPETLQDFEFRNFTFENVQNDCFHWHNDKVEVGLKNVKFVNNTARNCFYFCTIGSWTDLKDQTSISLDLEFSGNKVYNTRFNNVFTLNKCFNIKFHDNIIDTAGSPDVDNQSHQGLVFMRWSDGEIYNNYITKGGGNAYRILCTGYKKRGFINLHDNYVVNMRRHSAVETNADNLAVISGDISVKYNTFGNLAKGDYESAGVAVYLEEKPNKDTFIENNVVFNTTQGVIFQGDGSDPKTDINNFYFDSSTEAGVDIATGRILPSSPAYGKAGAFTTPTLNILLKLNLTDGKTFKLYVDKSYSLI